MADVGLYDLVFKPGISEALGVMLDRPLDKTGQPVPAVVQGGYSAAEADDAQVVQTIPEIQSDFSGGAFYSKRTLPNGYHYGAPAYCRSPRGVVPPGAITQMVLPTSFGGPITLGAITDSFELGGHLHVLAGRYALRLLNGSATPTVVADLGAGFVADGADVFNGNAYVGGSGGNIFRMTAAGAWSQSGNVAHRKAAVVSWLIPSEGQAKERLAMATADLTGVRYTGGDPMNIANWTPNPGSIAAGDAAYPISSLVTAPSHVYIATVGGLRDLNSRGETPNITPYHRRGSLSPENGAACIYHNGYVYFGHVMGIDRIDVTTGRRQNTAAWAFPQFGVPNRSPVRGFPTAWALDQGWLMPAIYDEIADVSYIGAGRDRSEAGVPEGPGPVLWHFAEAVIPGRVTALRATVVGREPRLWIAATHAGVSSLSWQALPNAGDPTSTPVADAAFRFGSALNLYTSAYDWGDPDAQKIVRLIGVRADNLGGGVSATLSANAEGGAWTLQGTARTSPRTRLAPRSPLTQGYEIGLKVEAIGSGSLPPVLGALKIDAELQNEQFDRRTYMIRVGKGQSLRGGQPDTRSATRVWDDVVDLQREGILELRDPEGALLDVRVHPISEYEAVEDTAHSGTYTRRGRLSLTVLQILSSATTEAGARWGSGQVWGSGRVWGGIL